MIGCAFALLIFCLRAASAQENARPALPPGAQSDPYGYVPIQNVTPDSQPYGIKPIPGYTPPVSPPDALRGSFEAAPALPPPRNDYGYRPLRQSITGPASQSDPAPLPVGQPDGPDNYGYVPLRPAETAAPSVQPPLRASTASDDNGSAAGPRGTDPRFAYQAPASPGAIGTGYQLGPGDKIRVTVFGESDLSGEYQVDGSGMVRLPLIGTLQANGATAPVLEQNIAAALEDGYIKTPRVNVEITLYRPFYIIGAVNRPGQYPYVDHMSALNAVALAGGFTDQAVQSSVYVRHEGSATEQAVETSQLTHVLPGDVVRVRTSAFWEVMNLFSPIAGPAAIAAANWH